MDNDTAIQLAEEFLDAYDANDDDKKLNALRHRLGLDNEPCILAGMLKYFAERNRVQC